MHTSSPKAFPHLCAEPPGAQHKGQANHQYKAKTNIKLKNELLSMHLLQESYNSKRWATEKLQELYSKHLQELRISRRIFSTCLCTNFYNCNVHFQKNPSLHVQPNTPVGLKQDRSCQKSLNIFGRIFQNFEGKKNTFHILSHYWHTKPSEISFYT